VYHHGGCLSVWIFAEAQILDGRQGAFHIDETGGRGPAPDDVHQIAADGHNKVLFRLCGMPFLGRIKPAVPCSQEEIAHFIFARGLRKPDTVCYFARENNAVDHRSSSKTVTIDMLIMSRGTGNNNNNHLIGLAAKS
jgi:hypothetical protein